MKAALKTYAYLSGPNVPLCAFNGTRYEHNKSTNQTTLSTSFNLTDAQHQKQTC